MPRKRGAKAVSSAVAQSGEESSNSSSNEDRLQKIDLYLQDFDVKVDKIKAQARTDTTAMCNAIKHAFMMELMKLPKNIQDMTMEEFTAKGGSISNAVLRQVSEVTDSLASSIVAQTTASSSQPPAPSSSSSSSTHPPASGENAAKAKMTAAKKKGARGRKTTATATKRSARTRSVLTNSQEMNTMPGTAEPQTLRRSTRKKATRNQFVTPAANTGRAGALRTGWDTPMVTPKFDPRLPVTPSTCVMRNPKRGETIISLSGSPIIVPTAREPSKPETIIPLADGRALTIGLSSPQVDLAIDEPTRRNMLLLQNNLAKILKNLPPAADS